MRTLCNTVNISLKLVEIVSFFKPQMRNFLTSLHVVGGVQFWHTPFGDLQPSALLKDLDSIFVHHDGSLVIPKPSLQHSGQYYCVLHHTEGTTLWPYELHVGHNNQNADDEREQDHNRAAHRSKRTIRPRNKGSDEQFAGAVVASVLLTFVVGFSAGALTRTHVLRFGYG